MVSTGKGNISEKLGLLLLCKEMRWDYYTYLRQPDWFIDGLSVIKNIDTEVHNIRIRQAEKKHA